ncbi:kinase-like domain-containing protein [Rhodocollybia butyracea]|uniref:Kinase-like domain-containing protein n=1 Tax=Rhodocollybia butyracea TaxID=206335 RepID=A0A9P5Q5H7_9AGAR|nr:kinase-like domain-containing protein [Rhodocollybia butyracea]
MNLIDSILTYGLPKKFPAEHHSTFVNTAHQCLIRLSEASGRFPDQLIINNDQVKLINKNPVNNGGFAEVYRGRRIDLLGSNVEVAFKVLRYHDYMPDANEQRQRMEKMFCKEALIWQYLKHDNIVTFLGIDLTTFSPRLAMVAEWMRNGSILDYMVRRSPFSMYTIDCQLKDIAAGLAYLHSQNVVHGDLCGRNILVDKRGHARLTDFGLTAFTESDTALKSSVRSGSPPWMAPELLVPDQFGLKFQRTCASDIYAFACVCCELWSEGLPPFHPIPYPGIIIKVSAGERPERPDDTLGYTMPENLWEITQLCWQQEPVNRPHSFTVSVMVQELSAHHSGVHSTTAKSPIGSKWEAETDASSGSESDEESSKFIQPPVPPRAIQKRRKGKGRSTISRIHETVIFGPVQWGPILRESFSLLSKSLRCVKQWRSHIV